MGVAENGLGLELVKVIMVMGEVLYDITESGFGLKPVMEGWGKEKGADGPLLWFYVWWRLIGGYVFRAGRREVIHRHL